MNITKCSTIEACILTKFQNYFKCSDTECYWKVIQLHTADGIWMQLRESSQPDRKDLARIAFETVAPKVFIGLRDRFRFLSQPTTYATQSGKYAAIEAIKEDINQNRIADHLSQGIPPTDAAIYAEDAVRHELREATKYLNDQQKLTFGLIYEFGTLTEAFRQKGNEIPYSLSTLQKVSAKLPEKIKKILK